MLEEGQISWAKAKAICKEVLSAEPGRERATLEAALAAMKSPESKSSPKVLTYRTAAKKLKEKTEPFQVSGEDVLALLQVLRERAASAESIARVRAAFPGLLES